MSTAARVMILHGSYGCPEENWFPWLRERLESMGIGVGVPRLPTPEGQSLDAWRAAFDEQMGALTSSDVLVGHSLGAAFAFRLLERVTTPVRGTFLIGAFVGRVGIEKFDTVNESFFAVPFDWPRIRRMGGEMFLYDGDDDPYVTRANVLGLSRSVEREVIWIPQAGHINVKSGYVEFPEILLNLLDVCARGPGLGEPTDRSRAGAFSRKDTA
jgi:uncharacterized protein